MKKLLTLCLTTAIFVSTSAYAEESTSITIYSKAAPGSISPNMYRPTPGGAVGWGYGAYNQIPGYAVVREQREVDLKDRRFDLKFTDVAALIDPTTVSFKSLTDPKGTSVVEQNYHFDLVNSQKLLERYLGQKITVEQNRGEDIEIYKGTLLSAMGGLILQGEDGTVKTINGYSNIQFPELPGGLITKPTLIWDIAISKPGAHDIEASYQTQGITWWSDYNAIFSEGEDANSGFLDLGAWVSIVNKSGATYDNAKLKLIAGDVHRAPLSNRNIMGYAAKAPMAMEANQDIAGFAEKSFFEFHLYTLGRPATIPDNSTKQIELFPKATRIPAEKLFVYYGADRQYRYYGGINTNRDYGVQSNKKVDVYLKFENEDNHGLGIPLPSGRVRVSKQDDADGSLEFIGEDVIDHTPKDEEILIKMGSAFDVVGERKQTDFFIDNGRKYMDETFEISLRNHKDASATVLVKETLYRGANWKIFNNNHSYDKVDAHTIEFPIRVPKDGEKVIKYTVRYTWR